MKTKLTLTLNEDLIKVAKAYARKRGISLSLLVEHYLRTLTEADEDKNELSARVIRLKGAIKLPPGFDYKPELIKSLSKKYKD